VLRRGLGALAAAAVLSLAPSSGPVQAAPAPPSDPLAGFDVHPEWGTIAGHDAVLRRGCRKYTFSYSITPPEGIWAIEVFISGPRFKRLAAGAFLDGSDPETGTGTYKLCRVTTRPGRFLIQAKLSVDDGSGHITQGLLPADTYKLRHPRRH
jgi:hypothetical protein